MLDSLGFSVYLSTFQEQWPTLLHWSGTGAPVFLSLHIGEEFHADYCRQAESVCSLLAEHGFRILADVSTKTLEMFGEPDLIRLALRLHVWALRIDYGFSREEIGAMAEKMPIVLNASTTSYEDAVEITGRGNQVFALHNFYPRPETGLDRELFSQTTCSLQKAGLKVQCFIPGDTQKRGPIFEGLPTLEEHRNVLPSAAFADLALRFGIRDIFVADPGISQKEQDRIARLCREGVISVPAELNAKYAYLYDQVFTCRVDSPKWLVRFTESRTYACPGETVEPWGCTARTKGCITMDNKLYGRYSGEIQMIRGEFPADDRVNVIGHVPENAWLLMECIAGGRKFTLVRP